MTEGILVNDAQTQTNLPLPDCMYSFLEDNPMRYNVFYYNPQGVSAREAENELYLKRIQETRKEIRKFDKKKKRREKHQHFSDDSLSSSDDNNYLRPKHRTKMKNKVCETRKQWYFPEDRIPSFLPYSKITNRPSGTMPKNYVSFRNMRMFPNSQNQSECKCKCQCGLGTSETSSRPNNFQDSLVTETTSLLNELESLSISKSKWKNDPEFQIALGEEIDHLNDKYAPMLKKTRDRIEKLEKNLKNPPIQKKHFDYL